MQIAHQAAVTGTKPRYSRPQARGFAPSEVSDRGWDLLLACVAVYLLMSVGRIHSMFGVIGILRPVLVSGVVAAALYTLSAHPLRRLEGLRSWPTTALLALTIWITLSVPGSLRQALSFAFLVEYFLKTAVITYVIIVGSVRGARDVERLAFAYFLSAAIYSVVILIRFGVGESSWRLEDLYTYDANDFAVLAVSAVPLAVYFLGGRARPVALRLVVGLGLGAIGVSFVWAGSRGGFLALGGVVLFMLVRYRAIPVRWRLLSAAVLTVTLLGIASVQFWEQMRTILEPTADYNLTADTGRLQIWRRGLGYMLDRPLFGVGPENFQTAEGVLSPLAWRQAYGIGVLWSAPHNSLIQVGAELGVPGLLFFIAFVACALHMLRRIERHVTRKQDPSRPDPRALAQAITGALVGFMVGAFFLSLAYSVMLYALVALAVALGKVTFWGGKGAVPSGISPRTPVGGTRSWRSRAR